MDGRFRLLAGVRYQPFDDSAILDKRLEVFPEKVLLQQRPKWRAAFAVAGMDGRAFAILERIDFQDEAHGRLGIEGHWMLLHGGAGPDDAADRILLDDCDHGLRGGG